MPRGASGGERGDSSLIFSRTELSGVWILEGEPQVDERGYFSRAYCRNELGAHGLSFDIAQCSVSYNRSRGTLRGMHYQIEPHQETKLVRCTRGSVYDVVLDLRPRSATFKRWIAEELSAANQKMMYVPANCAHGFVTMEPDTELLYFISTEHQPDYARGVRWDDPLFAIHWPIVPTVLSDRDRDYPDFAANAL